MSVISYLQSPVSLFHTLLNSPTLDDYQSFQEEILLLRGIEGFPLGLRLAFEIMAAFFGCGLLRVAHLEVGWPVYIYRVSGCNHL